MIISRWHFLVTCDYNPVNNIQVFMPSRFHIQNTDILNAIISMKSEREENLLQVQISSCLFRFELFRANCFFTDWTSSSVIGRSVDWWRVVCVGVGDMSVYCGLWPPGPSILAPPSWPQVIGVLPAWDKQYPPHSQPLINRRGLII